MQVGPQQFVSELQLIYGVQGNCNYGYCQKSDGTCVFNMQKRRLIDTGCMVSNIGGGAGSSGNKCAETTTRRSGKTCTCSNGTPATGASCTSNGAHICASCNTGYHKTSNIKCAANSCSCSNGNKATGAACTSNGANICASCKAGFYKSGNECKSCPANSYQNANSFTGSRCSCNSGYHKSGNSCAANACSCSNGNEATGAACTSHNANICASLQIRILQEREQMNGQLAAHAPTAIEATGAPTL